MDRVSVENSSVRLDVNGHVPFVRDAPQVGVDSDIYYEAVDDRWSMEYDFSAI